MRTRVSLSAVVCVASAVLCGCGGGTPDASSRSEAADDRPSQVDTPVDEVAPDGDLDAYISSARKADREASEAMGSDNLGEQLYSSSRIKPVYPEGVELVFVFRERRDVQAARRYFKTEVPGMSTTFYNSFVPNMNRLGFTHPSLTWTYKNADGSLIWSRTFSCPEGVRPQRVGASSPRCA